MIDVDELKERACSVVDHWADRLVAASHDIWEHPELNFEEHHAHQVLTDVLDDAGLAPTRGAHGLPTAFRADFGSEGPVVAVLSEYDALPEIGHACGHNIIGTAGVGAGIAAAAVANDAGGQIRILGTPAEEGGGGKIMMANDGAFEGVTAAMMVHPAGRDLTEMSVIAIHELWVTYSGQEAHAAAAPQLGRNALDAAVLGYMNVAALRQHIRTDERIHGIFTDAGDKPNIVPARAAANWYIRAGTTRRLQDLKARVVACLEAGAQAAGCEMEIRWSDVPFSDMIPNQPFVDLYANNAERIGRNVAPPGKYPVAGSTDMGNVSYLVPSIHPMIAVSDPSISIHTPAFATAARSEAGDRAVIDGAKAMAMTAIDLWTQPHARRAVAEAFSAVTASGPVGP